MQRESATAKELLERNRDLMEALEQQSATSDVLKVISQSTLDLQVVLDTLVQKATELCGAKQGIIFRFDGEVFRAVAEHGTLAQHSDFWRTHVIHPGRGSATGRAALERRPIHIRDVLADPEYQMTEGQRSGQFRTLLSVPMLREGNLVGAIGIWRTEVQPFTDKQIELVATFADQAVIAIENVRLFQELTEALEQQTATSEILGVIASSPTNIQPVLDALTERAARLCDADDAQLFLTSGDVLQRVAGYGSIPFVTTIPAISRKTPGGRAVIDRTTVHVEDLAAQMETEFPDSKARQPTSGARTVLATPLLREGSPIGVINIRRTQVRPFSDKQIALLKTFADQAVIAIENVRLFQEIQDKNDQLEAANRHKSQFLANVSHELRTPLNSIIGFTRIVLRRTEGKIEPLQKENLQKVLVSSDHLLSLINELLDLAKIEAGRMEAFAETFKLDEIIRVATTTVEPLLRNGNVKLITEVAPDIPPMKTDRDKLKQCVLNLLSNAVKFTERGEIKVAAARDNGTVKLTVSDTGIGMNQEALKYIFDEFRQADMSSTRRYGGTGLGLAIVKKFINLMGGEIVVESEEGKGSKFTITLPMELKQ